ncbi:TOMM precursor leader peptide-binding protein [Aquimarina aggregata]|uniref:TOMM precursor leader peptide-binding protein n=1 Tax=Aquimarina aggregata TaxID=1642818 RepID=UPI00249010DC|nr:TOMM precursor leader peptide-binding protein [Aquimarina aggregata]
MEEQNLILHPDVHWVKVDEKRIQLRQPDGEHITFDEHANDILNALKVLRTPSINDIKVDESISEQIKEILHTRGLLIHKDNASNFQIQRLIDQHGVSGGKVATGKNPISVTIMGEGKLASVSKTSLLQAEIKIIDDQDKFSISEDKLPLMIVICDQEDHDFLQKMNAKAIQNKQPILFFRWFHRSFKLGPFVVPGETACLNCAHQRELASSLFPNELLAYRSSGRDDLPVYNGGPVLDQMAGALLTRQVLTILSGNYDLSEPSTMITVDPVLLNIKHSPILRIPRCRVCSNYENEPLRAIRDQL